MDSIIVKETKEVIVNVLKFLASQLTQPIFDWIVNYRYRDYDRLNCQIRYEGDQTRVLVQYRDKETIIAIDPNGSRDTFFLKQTN